MKERIDESWRRYLWNLLCDPIGVNLRNRLAHGLLPKADKKEAALLIHADQMRRAATGLKHAVNFYEAKALEALSS